MRSVSGAFNRIILATFGLALVAAASWFVASGLGAGRYWPDADRYLAPAQDSVSSIVAPLTHSNWLIPIAALLSLFAIVAGAFVLIKQIPRKAAASPLRITGSESSLLASLAPDVLSQALSERAQEIPGVEQCSVWVAGSHKNLWVQADITVSRDSAVEWAVSALRNRLNEDIATSLGAAPRQIDVLMNLNSPSRSNSRSEAVTGQRAPVIDGSNVDA